jgi:hypothetical protein
MRAWARGRSSSGAAGSAGGGAAAGILSSCSIPVLKCTCDDLLADRPARNVYSNSVKFVLSSQRRFSS